MTESGKNTDNKKPGKNGKETSGTKRKVLIVVMLVVVAFGAWHYARLTASYRGENPVWVRIPGGASEPQAKDSIINALGPDRGPTVAQLWSGDVEKSAGAYLIEPRQRAWQIARRISRGQQTPVKVTFNNVRTLDELAERLAGRMDFSAEEFLKATAEVAARDSISTDALTARLLPDTYEAYWSDTPQRLIDKLLAHYRKVWTPDRLAKAEALGLSAMQVTILASIVEEETNKRDERPAVARLYLNRLAKGMPLQADPTVKFASGDFAAKRITGPMLAIDSPYNTYKYPGLPPGVIRLPELRSVDAVLNAPAHDYIYMCARADLSGYHDFTADYSRHLANAAAFRKAAYGAK